MLADNFIGKCTRLSFSLITLHKSKSITVSGMILNVCKGDIKTTNYKKGRIKGPKWR